VADRIIDHMGKDFTNLLSGEGTVVNVAQIM